MFRHKVWSLICTVVVITLMCPGHSNAGQNPGVAGLEWMAGCWVSDDGKERIEEFWLKPAGEVMIGLSRTVAGGQTVFIEYAKISAVESKVAYTVSLGMGAKPVSFKLVKSADDEAVFENPEHDFPRRIIYRRESKDALFARIEGQEKGVARGMDFRYKRSNCD